MSLLVARNIRWTALVLGLIGVVSGCAKFQQFAELSSVKFSLERVSSVRLAGVDIMDLRTARQLNMQDAGRISRSVFQKRLPLEMTLHLRTENPLVNQVAASLVSMEWTLLLDGKEAISGSMNTRVSLPAGQPQDIPLTLGLDLIKTFSDKRATELLDMALAYAGRGGGVPKGVALRVLPTIDTPIGPIRYPSPITVTVPESM